MRSDQLHCSSGEFSPFDLTDSLYLWDVTVARSEMWGGRSIRLSPLHNYYHKYEFSPAEEKGWVMTWDVNLVRAHKTWTTQTSQSLKGIRDFCLNIFRWMEFSIYISFKLPKMLKVVELLESSFITRSVSRRSNIIRYFTMEFYKSYLLFWLFCSVVFETI